MRGNSIRQSLSFITVAVITIGVCHSLTGGICTLYDDTIYYTGGTLGSHNFNPRTYKFDLKDVNHLKSGGPWVPLEFKREEKDKFDFGVGVNMKNGSIVYVSNRNQNLDIGVSILDLINRKVVGRKELGPHSQLDGIDYTLVASTTVIKDDQTILHYGGTFTGHRSIYNRVLQQFDIPTSTWTKFSELGPIRTDAISVYYDDKFILLGGYISGLKMSPLSELSTYDFNLNKWTTVTATGEIPASVVNPSYSQEADNLYLLGGIDATGGKFQYTDTIYSLNLKTYQWQSHPILGIGSQITDGCLVYYRGLLLSDFNNRDLIDQPQLKNLYIINTHNWSLVDYSNLAKGGSSLMEIANLIKPTNSEDTTTTTTTILNSSKDNLKTNQRTTTNLPTILLITLGTTLLSLLTLITLKSIYHRYYHHYSLNQLSHLQPIWIEFNPDKLTSTNDDDNEKDPIFSLAEMTIGFDLAYNPIKLLRCNYVCPPNPNPSPPPSLPSSSSSPLNNSISPSISF